MNDERMAKNVVIGTITIIILLIGNILYANMYKISKPIFFKHYYEDVIYENHSRYLDIHYITNINEKNILMNIKFPEIDNPVYIKYNNEYEGKYYNHQVGKFKFDISKEDFEKQENNIITLDDGIATFRDGTTMPINIGKIILYNRYNKDEKLDILKNTSSSSSSDQRSSAMYTAKGKVNITKIESQLPKDILDMFKIGISTDDKCHEEVMMPIDDVKLPITAYNRLQVFTKANNNNGFVFARVLLKLYYEDMDNNEGYIELLNMRYEPHLSDKDIVKYVESIGE
jgi:hypothetical protein